MVDVIKHLSTQVPIVRPDGTPTPYFARLLESISDAKIAASIIEALGGDPGSDQVVTWDDSAESLDFKSLSDVLDFIGSAAHGDILYRDSAGWARLGAGTAGQVLQTNGASADPTWVTPSSSGQGPWTSVASGTFSGSVVSVTGLAAYNEIMIVLNAATLSSSGIRIVTVSTNNGSSYFTSSGNYIHVNADGTTASRSNIEMHTTATTSGRSCYCHIVNTEGQRKVIYTATTDHWFVGDTSNDIDAIQIGSTAGNLNGGTYQVLAR